MAAIKIDIKAIELLKAYQGCTTPAQKQALCDSLVQCTADLALEPLWKKCRMQAGLMKFEREKQSTRRTRFLLTKPSGFIVVK